MYCKGRWFHLMISRQAAGTSEKKAEGRPSVTAKRATNNPDMSKMNSWHCMLNCDLGTLTTGLVRHTTYGVDMA